ncbi:MAG: YqgE/AlgH family protein [Gaiella sp.]
MDTLRGRLLIAGPLLHDPSFRRTVVLVGEHGDDGAMGVVLNRPSPITVAEAAEPLAELVEGDELVHVGGPVQPDAIVVLAEFAEPARAGAIVFDAIGFLPGEIDAVEELGELHAVRVFAGYAGWGPGQLEAELEEGAWIVEPARAGDVFTDEPDHLWSAVLRRRGGRDALLGLLPADPRLN